MIKEKVVKSDCPLEGTSGVLWGCFTQSFTEFFEVDCVERGSQSSKLRTFHFFVFLPRIKGLLGFF